MARGHAMSSEGLERVLHPPRTDADHGEKYDGEAALWPSDALDLDPARHEAEGCWPAISVQRLIGSNVPRYRAECRHCHGSWRGATEAEAMAKAKRAHD